MRSIVRAIIAVGVLLLTACTPYYDDYRYGASGASGAYSDANLDELLRFGADLANRSGSSRAETCRALLKRHQANPSVGVKLHLMMGRTLSDSCGDISKIVSSVNAIPSRDLPDSRLQWLIDIQSENLKRLASASRRSAGSDRKTNGGQESSKDEARILREKLEAIRSLEKKMDETDVGN